MVSTKNRKRVRNNLKSIFRLFIGSIGGRYFFWAVERQFQLPLVYYTLLYSSKMAMMLRYYYLFLLPLAAAFSSKYVLKPHTSIHRRANERSGAYGWVYQSSLFVQTGNRINGRKHNQADVFDSVTRNENLDDAPSEAKKAEKAPATETVSDMALVLQGG